MWITLCAIWLRPSFINAWVSCDIFFKIDALLTFPTAVLTLILLWTEIHSSSRILLIIIYVLRQILQKFNSINNRNKKNPEELKQHKNRILIWQLMWIGFWRKLLLSYIPQIINTGPCSTAHYQNSMHHWQLFS